MTSGRPLPTLVILLITILLAAPLTSAEVTADGPSPQPTFSIAAHIQPSAPPTSARLRLIATLRNPEVAVLTLGAGVLLIFLECNLPGAILPGAIGLLLVLSALFGLHLLPLHGRSLAAIVAAAALLLLCTRTRWFGPLAIAGTTGLAYGLSTLVVTSPVTPSVHPAVGASVGLVIGLTAAALGRVAARARRNKAILAVGSAVRS